MSFNPDAKVVASHRIRGLGGTALSLLLFDDGSLQLAECKSTFFGAAVLGPAGRERLRKLLTRFPRKA